MKVGDNVQDLMGELGFGTVIDIYVSYEQETPVTVYIVSFDNDVIADRYLHELKEAHTVPTDSVDHKRM